jgi:hypothetical protein
MKQELSDWASVAEIASGIAVVTTLVLLVFGIRENTDAIRASTYAQSINSLNEWRDSIYESREIAGLWEAFRAGDVEGLDSLDRGRLAQFVNSLFTIYEHSYFSWQRGLIGDSEWERFEANICLQYSRVARLPQLMVVYQGALTEEFREFVTDLCSD